MNLECSCHNNCVDLLMKWLLNRRRARSIGWMKLHSLRLNGRQGDIDSDDRKACEEALKVAKVNLSARHS